MGYPMVCRRLRQASPASSLRAQTKRLGNIALSRRCYSANFASFWGVESWILRLYDSIALGCIPILVAGDVDLPFEAMLDYSEFSVKIPPKSSSEVAVILHAVPETAKSAKRTRLEGVKAAFSWPEPGVAAEDSAFGYLLRELLMKVRYMRHSGHKFWTHLVANG